MTSFNPPGSWREWDCACFTARMSGQTAYEGQNQVGNPYYFFFRKDYWFLKVTKATYTCFSKCNGTELSKEKVKILFPLTLSPYATPIPSPWAYMEFPILFSMVTEMHTHVDSKFSLPCSLFTQKLKSSLICDSSNLLFPVKYWDHLLRDSVLRSTSSLEWP